MAKDRRNKTRQTRDLEQPQTTQVRSTAQVKPAQTAEKKPRKKKKKLSRAALILRCVLVVLILAVVIFLCVLGNYIYQAVFVDDTEKIASISPTSYDTTPTQNKDKVQYYLVGILGESDSSDMTMLSMVCYDKQKQQVNVLQIPSATYLGNQDEWAVDHIGAIWANPKAIDWCETCRKRVYEPEINEGEVATHTVCGTEITSKTGSSFVGLIDAINDGFSLPVDHYFVLPRKGLRVLIDSLGGVDIELAEDLTLDGTDLPAGVHTLTGAQAMEYATYSDGTISRELVRAERQRAVLGAVLTRLFRMDTEALEDDVIEELMDSAYALRSDCETSDIVSIITELAKAGTENTTVYLLPGEAATANSGEVYTVHTSELTTLLNSAFNPYGTAITASDSILQELINSGDADQKVQTLSACVTDQTGKLLETEE